MWRIIRKIGVQMSDKYYNFLAEFMLPEKRERIIFQLTSKKKRDNAFDKMTAFQDCFNSKYIYLDISHYEDDDAIMAIEKATASKNCFSLELNEILSIKNAYKRAVNSSMLDILIIDENTIVYIGEYEYGASEKHILGK